MRRLIVLGCLLACFVGAGHAQGDMPEEVRRFLDNYIKDSAATRGPLGYKKIGVIRDSVPITDLRPRVLQMYRLKWCISIEAYSDTVILSEIIEPTGFWRVSVGTQNRSFYDLTLDNTTGEPKITGVSFPHPADSTFRSPTWGPLLETYPESTGINPVLIISSWLTDDYQDLPVFFLYFKQKDPKSIYYVKRGSRKEQLEALFPASIETLNDSRKLVEYWKRENVKKNNRTAANERMKQENAVQSIGTDENATPQRGSSPAYRRGELHKMFPVTSDTTIGGAR